MIWWPAFVACTRGGDAPDTEIRETEAPSRREIVVFWTLDTLGATAADEAGYCASLGAIAAAHGLALACVPGGISPSSWTAPAHTRLLWPDHAAPPLTNRDAPRCDATGALAVLAEGLDGTYVFGADNAVLGPGARACGDGRSPFAQGADVAFAEVLEDPPTFVITPEPERAVHAALDEVEARLPTGEPLVVFLNAFEVGGHRPPRCAETPTTPGCDALWQYAVRRGLVAPDDDRREAWLSRPMLVELEPALVADFDRDPLAARDMLWDSMHETMAAARATMLEQRLARLLDAVEAAGRTDDLLLVMVGDHGESPGQLSTGGGFNPSHGGQPNEWTAPVPVYVAPAALVDDWRAAGLVGDAGAWWSTANLSRALLRHLDVAEPAGWPAPEAPGAALSWACNDFRDPTVGAAGIYVTDAGAVRCENTACEVTTFALPADLAYLPSPLDDAALSAWISDPNGFVARCAVPPP